MREEVWTQRWWLQDYQFRDFPFLGLSLVAGYEAQGHGRCWEEGSSGAATCCHHGGEDTHVTRTQFPSRTQARFSSQGRH